MVAPGRTILLERAYPAVQVLDMPDTGNFVYLSERILENLGVTTLDAVGAIENLINGRAEGTVWSAPKAVVQPPDGRYLMATLAAAERRSITGL